MADEQFGVSAEERRAIEERAKIRLALRKEYQKQVSNPFRHASGEGGVLFDPAVQRFMSMKVTGYDHFKPTPKSSAALAFLIVPMFLYGWWMKSERDAKEEKYRTGQVSYRDRKFKFI